MISIFFFTLLKRNNTNGVLRGEIEWSNSLKKDPTILLTNFMCKYHNNLTKIIIIINKLKHF